MDDTSDFARRYNGGQIQIEDVPGGCLQRGEIETVTLEGEGDACHLVLELNWLAQMTDGAWVRIRADEQVIHLDIPLKGFEVDETPDGRFVALNHKTVENVVLLPQGHDMTIPSYLSQYFARQQQVADQYTPSRDSSPHGSSSQ